MSKVPEITQEQRMAALRKGMEARMERARIKRAVKRREVCALDALSMDAAQGIRVLDFIAALPGYGKVTAAALMRSLKISPTRRVRGLGSRQREALAEVLRDVY